MDCFLQHVFASFPKQHFLNIINLHYVTLIDWLQYLLGTGKRLHDRVGRKTWDGVSNEDNENYKTKDKKGPFTYYVRKISQKTGISCSLIRTMSIKCLVF